MIDCGTFLDQHSDYRDRRLDSAAHLAMKKHIDECDECRRHDQAIRRGVDILRQSEIKPRSEAPDMAALRKRAMKPTGRDDNAPSSPGPDLVAALLAAIPTAVP